ncbi:hypothetical protein GCM10011499_38200 [Pelagibacterium lentulum]|uniref:Uncharacterized protein n=1 Tax=Pelagibacterium lentulum TaxID=2029865 RepID=A0A916RPC7_9HYPH|nr:hypothetical protein GCM10011499_38200 [Pelagibacterium lentulum]
MPVEALPNAADLDTATARALGEEPDLGGFLGMLSAGCNVTDRIDHQALRARPDSANASV